jgi:hypothetical protein
MSGREKRKKETFLRASPVMVVVEGTHFPVRYDHTDLCQIYDCHFSTKHRDTQKADYVP